MNRTVTTAHAVRLFGSAVGPREVEVIASDGTLDLMGDILEPDGADFTSFITGNPIVLAQHDNTMPIARCTSIVVRGGQLIARVEFPPPGTSATADEYLRLIKAGVISAVSVGFVPVRWEPLKGGMGLRYTAWRLLELSFVSVPANPSALVTARAFGGRTAEADRAFYLARVSALRRPMDAPRRHAADDLTPDQMGARIAELRAAAGFEVATDPRLIVADAAFRLRGA